MQIICTPFWTKSQSSLFSAANLLSAASFSWAFLAQMASFCCFNIKFNTDYAFFLLCTNISTSVVQEAYEPNLSTSYLDRPIPWGTMDDNIPPCGTTAGSSPLFTPIHTHHLQKVQICFLSLSVSCHVFSHLLWSSDPPTLCNPYLIQACLSGWRSHKRFNKSVKIICCKKFIK